MVGSIVISHAGSRDVPPGGIRLQGAGSTFAAPLYKKWIDTYRPRHPETLVSYEAIGSGLATLLNTPMPENFRVFFPDPEGEDSYPIVTYSWLLLYKQYDDPQKATALKDYVRWCLIDGQEFNESLGFVRLPPRVASRPMQAVGSMP